MRECGLKSGLHKEGRQGIQVTPRAGVWIEIVCHRIFAGAGLVTPRAGVWIEIRNPRTPPPPGTVTPRAGVWIEIKMM